MNDTENATTHALDETIVLEAGAMAYIKEVTMDGAVGYGIHAPDGQLLGIAPNRDIAFAVARQNELDPVSVH